MWLFITAVFLVMVFLFYKRPEQTKRGLVKGLFIVFCLIALYALFLEFSSKQSEQRPYLRAIGAPVILVQSHPLAATCRLDRGRSKMAEGNGNHHSNCIRALVEYKS